MSRANYRKVYSDHFGAIPADCDGRSFDIHHIDGNHTNDAPSNLIAVSIQDHYYIHYNRGDWAACSRIATRLSMSPTEISNLVSKQQKERVENGTHHFLGGTIQGQTSRNRVTNRTHNFIGNQMQTGLAHQRVASGTHHFLGGELQKSNADKAVSNGSHNFVKSNPTRDRMAKGTHQFITNNPSTIIVQCPHCMKQGGKPNMMKYHFDRCKSK